MKRGPLIHQNRFDLTQKLNEQFLNTQGEVSLNSGSNESGGIANLRSKERPDDESDEEEEVADRLDMFDAAAAVKAVHKLKESDFPMTQLIKDRTINFVPPYESNSSSAEEYKEPLHQEVFDEPQHPDVDRYGRELGARYQYFRDLVRMFNQREEMLQSKLKKREELLKSINFY